MAPEIEYLDRELTRRNMAGLYTACDALVQPYRGEGIRPADGRGDGVRYAGHRHRASARPSISATRSMHT